MSSRRKDTKIPKEPRMKEFLEKDEKEREARIKRIEDEFRKGFEFLAKYGKAATFFGSSRKNMEDEHYRDATKLAAMLAKDDYVIITGGGPGIMHAANRGAVEGGGKSVGLNIQLPMEQQVNDFVEESEDFHYFFSRKVMLAFASEVYVFFPGGFGTLDEFFELATLVQTKKIEPIPIILVSREYWEPLLDWIKEEVYQDHKAIDEEDMDIYTLVDSAEEAYKLIKKLEE
ncbi:MAG: TIGR00730 family Rossman fold protein [Candidatus Spechtbacterales bacterium]|nr:TIGR00730 family Rossman fold protein [Candidatus Spechtbacterales bacterium]